VAADIRQLMQETAGDMPNGASVFLRGQVTTMTSAYQQPFIGLALALVLIYPLIVVNFQSWLDPFVIVIALPTALAGIVWMLFASYTTLSVPGPGPNLRRGSTGIHRPASPRFERDSRIAAVSGPEVRCDPGHHVGRNRGDVP
jgi:hypothetical protein